MRLNDYNKTVAARDVLVPKVGVVNYTNCIKANYTLPNGRILSLAELRLCFCLRR